MSYVGKITDTSGNTGLVGSTLYGTCSTGASTAAKVVTCSDFDKLLIGVTIHVKFTNSNTASTPTLNVNSTGAKNIYKYGTTKPGTTAATSWYAGSVVSFTYDGSYWQMNDHIDDTTISNTDEKVKQTESTTDAEYEVTFAGSTGTTTKTEGVGKSEYFKFNPSKRALTFGSRKSGSTVSMYSVAMGDNVAASQMYSYAEGVSTTASGTGSHAEGASTTASGGSSHAEGQSTTANHKSQHTFGEYNIEDPSTAAATERGNYVEIVGNGTADNARSNARTLDWSGNEWLAGSLTIGNPDTAEYTGLKYDGSRGALTIVGGQQYSGAAFYEPILTVKNNSQTMGTASINITPENIYFQGDTWDGTNGSLKDAISSLNSRYKVIPVQFTLGYKSSTQMQGTVNDIGGVVRAAVFMVTSTSGTPYNQVTRTTMDSGLGSTSCKFSAYGSGFVSGHVLGCEGIFVVDP